MMPRSRNMLVVAVAVVAGLLGVLAGLALNGPGPLWRSQWGQRLLQRSLAHKASSAEGVALGVLHQPLPQLQLPMADGSSLHLPDAYRGRKVLINAWAS